MSRKSIVYSVIFISVTALVLLAVPGLQDSAHAGVLLRSQRVTSRTNARPPRIRLGRVSSSTKVARRLNPISSRSIRGGSFNGVSSVLSYRKRQAKYQQRLYKFQVKQAKKEIKRRRKLERKREAKLRKERRALERQNCVKCRHSNRKRRTQSRQPLRGRLVERLPVKMLFQLTVSRVRKLKVQPKDRGEPRRNRSGRDFGCRSLVPRPHGARNQADI